jgi:hypothetical protein
MRQARRRVSRLSDLATASGSDRETDPSGEHVNVQSRSSKARRVIGYPSSRTEKMVSRKSIIHRIWKHCPRRVHTRPCEHSKSFSLIDCIAGRRGSHAKELRADAQTAYAVPLKGPPGRTYQYCSLNAFLAGMIIENAAHLPLEAFAKRNLFAPLGIDHFECAKAAGGWTKGQGNLSIRTRDLAAIGQMYLDRGLFHGQ